MIMPLFHMASSQHRADALEVGSICLITSSTMASSWLWLERVAVNVSTNKIATLCRFRYFDQSSHDPNLDKELC